MTKRSLGLLFIFTKIAWIAIALLLASLLSCSGLGKILGDSTPAPVGRYYPLEITGGSLMVSRGECGNPDLDKMQRRANAAIADMRAAWPGLEPIHVTVHSMPVSFSVDPWGAGVQATGVYHSDSKWIELRCGYENVIYHELGHALGHQLQIPCYRVIGHGYGMDCEPS